MILSLEVETNMSINKSPVIWLTGMSGAGKSTLASYLELLFLEKTYKVRVVDGDDIRGKDERKLDFGHKDVMQNNLRIANLCQELRKEYDVIIVPVISPYNDIRMQVRIILEPNFHLVYLKSDIQSLRDRDPKGLYAAADSGIINDLIGYSDMNPYDEPDNAEILIETGNHTHVETSRRQLCDYINKYIFI